MQAPRLIAASRRLAREAGRLSFGPPVRWVYNPLQYARGPWEAYLKRYASSPKRVVVLGMNPGPWGMAQTGVPFGEIAAVSDWLGIRGAVAAPPRVHPRVPILGFACTRHEVSGARLWGLLREVFGSAASMSRLLFVSNYCPLLFLDAQGRNLTPDRLRRADQPELFEACDRFLEAVVDALRPRWLVGVGRFAERRLQELSERTGAAARVTSIPHPSPANPASQVGWAARVSAALRSQGIFSQ